MAEFHKVGDAKNGIRRLLEGADPKQLEKRRDLIADMQERVQRLAVEATAGTSLADLGVVEGAAMKKQAESAALVQAQADAAGLGRCGRYREGAREGDQEDESCHGDRRERVGRAQRS